MGDFDQTQLASDWTAICGGSTTAGQSGESFTYGGVTYYGVFNQVDATLVFAEANRKDDEFAELIYARAVLTAGLSIDSEIRRTFDGFNYRVVHTEFDAAVWQHTVRKLYPRN